MGERLTTYIVEKAGSLHGSLEVPGDKSVSHRAIILGSLASGETSIDGLLEGEDVLSTISALKAMGVSIRRSGPGQFEISGVGIRGLRAPQAELNLGNSGTSLRLLCGLLVGQNFGSTLTGDGSLRKRPMGRVTNPLEAMGASIKLAAGQVAPLNIDPVIRLDGIKYKMPIASSQVKSAILLAGMYASEPTIIEENVLTRDHTERMLVEFGYPLDRDRSMIKLDPKGSLEATDLTIPGDFSSAAFFIVGASISTGSKIRLINVGVNPTRTGLLKILQMMGAKIVVENRRNVAGEPIADLVVESVQLRGVDVPGSLIAETIDEFPILSIAAANARGTTRILAASELRVKESDRISAIVTGLRSIGIDVTELSDGMVIEGGITQGGTVDSKKDHRIAMAFSMAGLNATNPIRILDCANISTSFPGFLRCGQKLGMNVKCEGAL
jgi:3-phosphoshikimate 1-carboxyvinyltransferase